MSGIESRYRESIITISYVLTTVENAELYLCGNGSLLVSVKNPGSTHVYNVISHTYLPKYIRYKNNSATYSYNGGADQSAGNPTINQISGGDYDGGYELIFDPDNISQFQDMSPMMR